jgi:hypothetical protein
LRILLLVVLVAFVACTSDSGGAASTRQTGSAAQPFAGADSPDRVELRADTLASSVVGWRSFRLTFGKDSAGPALDFALKLPGAFDPDSTLPATLGFLRRVRGRQGTSFIRALSRAFGADSSAQPGPQTDSLAIDVGVLGLQLDHARGKHIYAGEFTSDRAGDWLVTKLFFGDDDVEVFLAIAPRQRRAQLLAKDPEYANGVVRELSRLF